MWLDGRRCGEKKKDASASPGRRRREDRPRRGKAGQEARRDAECLARRRAVIVSETGARQGIARKVTARWIGVGARSIRRWRERFRKDGLRARARGRPARRASGEDRRELRETIRAIGPGAGIPRLQGLFPDLARREVACVLTSFRLACRREGKYAIGALHWHRVGAVWAIDYTEPPWRIDGTDRYLLNVRDLASGAVLLSLPAREESADVAAAALEALFRTHGAPLVLKSDNGGHFIADVIAALLERYGVLLLRSPARTPRYNGACEAGIGEIAAWVHYIAAHSGRPGEPTRGDVEEARLLANETGRPRGVRGTTPDEAWAARVPIGKAERDRARSRTAEILAEIVAIGRVSAACARRDATRRMLVECGILSMRRRLVRLSDRQLKRVRIS